MKTTRTLALLAAVAVFGPLSFAQTLTTLNFDSVDASQGAVSGTPVTNYLGSFGITVSGQTAGTQLAIMDERAIYGGGVIAAPSPHNVFSQVNVNAAVSFTFNFAQPVSNVSLVRAAVIVPTAMPQWTATALNAGGATLGTTGEGYLWGPETAQTFSLNFTGIKAVRFDSNGGGYAAFSAVVFDNFSFVSNGSISGTVKDSASNPIQGATVSVVAGGTTYSATSAADGTYAITSVPAGTGYTVTASAGSAYLNGTVNGVTVTAGGTTTGVNFALNAAPGTISGTVTNSASSPLQDATVSAVAGGTTCSTTSAADGTYAITNVPAGTGYTVTAGAGSAYLTGMVNGVTVTAGGTTTGVNFALNAPTIQTLFVCSIYGGTISKITLGGTVTTFVSGLNDGLTGLAFDGSGNLYVANQGTNSVPPWNGTISKITPGGTVTTFASGLLYPTGLAFDGSGNLYAASYGYGTISEITPGGTLTTFASGLSTPEGLAFDGSGNLYVGSSYGGTISEITPSGTVTTFASGLNYYPTGLAFDGSGNLYVAIQGNNAISKITPGGMVTTFAGGVTSVTGLAFDGSGNLYAASYSSNGTIYKITPSGTVTTFASGLSYPGFIAIQSQAEAIGAISGTVANGASNPLQGVTVSVVVSGTTYSATSASNGAYVIYVPAGTGYTVSASAGSGYANVTATGVNVTADSTTAGVNITLNVSYAAWAATVFTTEQLADPAISGETANPAHDGVSNLLKYAFTMNPLAPARSGLPVVGTAASGGSQYLTITYAAQPMAGDLTYSVQASTDMVNWTALTPAATATTTPVTVQDTTPLSAGVRRFLRVVVTGP